MLAIIAVSALVMMASVWGAMMLGRTQDAPAPRRAIVTPRNARLNRAPGIRG